MLSPFAIHSLTKPLRFWVSLLTVCVSLACTREATPARRPEAPAALPLHAYVPPGAAEVLFARPRVLLADEQLAGVLEVAFPADQHEAFRRRFFVPTDHVEELLFAWVPRVETAAVGPQQGTSDRVGLAQDAPPEEGFVLVARGDFSADDAVYFLGTRMNTVEVSAEAPRRRVGFMGASRREAVVLDEHTFLYSGDAGPAVASMLERLAEGQRGRADVAAWVRALGSPPVAFVRLVPLDLPANSSLGLVLAQQRQLAVGASVERPTEGIPRLVVQLLLSGDFPQGVERNLAGAARSVMGSDLGRVLGADEAVDRLRTDRAEETVRMSVSLNMALLTRGLRAVFVDEIPDLFRASE